MNSKFIDFVKLIAPPSRENGYFYIVESGNGLHYVSALFGREATGLAIGTKLKLCLSNPSKAISAHTLERV